MGRLLLPALFGLTLSGCLSQLAQQTVPDTPPVVAQPQPVLIAPEPEPLAESCLEPRDLWSRLRDGFQLNEHQHPRVANDLAWYASHESYLTRMTERATPYLHLIVEEIERRGLPMELSLLPVVESAFQPFAYSHGRAAGLWQFVPATGRRFKLSQTWWYDGRRDVTASTRAALDYLEYLHRYFNGDWLHALAAYNSGEGTVKRAIQRNAKKGKPTDYWSLDLPKETEGYVPKLLAISTLVANPPAQGVLLASVADAPYLRTVNVGSQIDLDLAAELAGISLEDIYRYNPGFNRWATDPQGPHQLLIPVDNVELFQNALAEYPAHERISWKRHKIKSGEVLGVIAENYRTNVDLIRKVNNIKDNNIRVGNTLIIPVARTNLSRYQLSSSQRLKSIQARKQKGQRIEYQVRDGDTLWEIARKYDVGVQQLAKWNGMAPRDTLRPGSKLVIWAEEQQKVSAINPADFVHPFEESTLRRIGYTVRNGDSLARISERFRVSISKLQSWNKTLQGKRYLKPGDRITLYVDVKRQSGNI
ncbi:MAG: LysM peptidoglycan-binding domain-containing protein [Gammaproteobacteria bacterium]|nr:LysM peptidoglycan-binding domain-containing protein [Gammaproteobacteria bacterium]